MRGLLQYLAIVVVLTSAVSLLMAGAVVVAARPSTAAVEAEAAALAAAPFEREAGKDVVVITGSSTVRFWRSSGSVFPEAQVVNTGFGGSTMAQLRRHYDGLIARFGPDRVFIGSGDNDLAAGRSVSAVLADTAALLAALHRDRPSADVALIAAKPSVQRWYLREHYRALNNGFARLAQADDRIAFVDVWNELLDAGGRVRPELYASDGLHLNRSGYRIYAAAIAASGPAA
jgi:lysophospholipase L1-like esterase